MQRAEENVSRTLCGLRIAPGLESVSVRPEIQRAGQFCRAVHGDRQLLLPYGNFDFNETGAELFYQRDHFVLLAGVVCNDTRMP